MKGRYKRLDKFLKNEDGSLVTNQEEIMKKWAQYFEKLLNCVEPVDTFTYGGNKLNDVPCPAPSKEKIEQQMNRLKNHKSPRGNDIQRKVLKHVDSSMIESIYLLIKKV